jgi:hypothetical protein
MKSAVKWYDIQLKEIDYQLQSGLINLTQCKVLMDEAKTQALQLEEEKMIEFAYFRDNHFEKSNTLEDFTIQNEGLIKLFKQQDK